MLDVISVILNFVRLVLGANMWSVLENVSCALEKNTDSVAFGCNVLKIPIMSIWSKISFKATVFFLIFCLDDVSIDVNGMLKSQS